MRVDDINVAEAKRLVWQNNPPSVCLIATHSHVCKASVIHVPE